MSSGNGNNLVGSTVAYVMVTSLGRAKNGEDDMNKGSCALRIVIEFILVLISAWLMPFYIVLAQSLLNPESIQGDDVLWWKFLVGPFVLIKSIPFLIKMVMRGSLEALVPLLITLGSWFLSWAIFRGAIYAAMRLVRVIRLTK